MTNRHGRPRVFSSSEKKRLVLQLERELQKDPEITFALLHGSFVQDGPFRDIDLALYVRRVDNRENLDDFDPYLMALGRYLKADL